ncbi:hypothetical protein [Pseudofrankia sp. DC12]|uniref:hypothetical protein n=1 Tax=Pseudofrankia sp. DC12 TaxID=683315 RepID=UPI0005F7BF47|nr:hypothetical protein [Pseudofrankia sp. DC12]
MIVKLDHASGGEIEAPVSDDRGVAAVDVARGLLAVVPGVIRVRVWDQGLGFYGEPSADETHDSAAGSEAVDEDRRRAREALAAEIADSLSAALLALAIPRPRPPSWVGVWRLAAAAGGGGWPFRAVRLDELPSA